MFHTTQKLFKYVEYKEYKMQNNLPVFSCKADDVQQGDVMKCLATFAPPKRFAMQAPP